MISETAQNLMCDAAADNNLPLMKKLHAIGVDLNAKGGMPGFRLYQKRNLHGLLWMQKQGARVRVHIDELFLDAAYNEDTSTLKVVMNGIPGYRPKDVDKLIRNCLLHDKFSTLRCLAPYGIMNDINGDALFDHLLANGNIALIDIATDIGIKTPTFSPATIYTTVAMHDSIDLLKWLESRGHAIDPNYMAERAILSRAPKVLCYIMDRGRVLPDESIEYYMNTTANAGGHDAPAIHARLKAEFRARQAASLVRQAFTAALNDTQGPAAKAPPHRGEWRHILHRAPY